MTIWSLEDALETTRNSVDMFRATGRHVDFPHVSREYSHWIEEQRAWRETCALADLSHHQMDQVLEGADVIDLLTALCVNSFTDFDVGQAKQPVMCNPDGKMIGDGLLQRIDEEQFVLSGSPSPANWLEYHIESGDYDASSTIYPMSVATDRDPRFFTYQLQGPSALDILDEATDGPLPEIPFFRFDILSIDGHEVRALRHGMAGEVGFELQGAYENGNEIKDTLLEVGADFGLRRLGTRSYKALPVIVGWVDVFAKALYEHEELRDYRRWLDADSFEGTLSIGGSFDSDDISDYYLSPVEVGYEHLINFDHEFMGREALEREVADPSRTLVTLVWNAEDVVGNYRSLFEPGATHKFMDLPRAPMRAHYDKVLKDSELVGLSRHPGYTYNERAMLSLCTIDIEYSEPGTDVSIVWGEPGGKSPNPTIERHTETEIGATVAPVPYVEDKRKSEW